MAVSFAVGETFSIKELRDRENWVSVVQGR